MESLPPLRHAMPRAAAALVLPCLVGIGLRMAAADFVVLIVATLVASIVGLMVAIRELGPSRSAAMVAMLVIYAVVPFAVAGPLTAARAFGPVLDVATAEAGRRPFAAGFLFTDGAAPRTDLAEAVTVVDAWYMRRGGPSRRQDTYVVAPVVPPGWAPGQVVNVVAIAASRHELSRRVPEHEAWSAPGGLLRVLDDELQSRAVRRALERRGLAPAGDLVIGTWEPSPGLARLEASVTALVVLGAALAIVLGLAAFDRLVPPRREGRRG